LLGAIDAEVFGFIDGGFDAQDAAFLVIHLDGVAVEGVFDANAFGPMLEVADDFAFEVGMDASVAGGTGWPRKRITSGLAKVRRP